MNDHPPTFFEVRNQNIDALRQFCEDLGGKITSIEKEEKDANGEVLQYKQVHVCIFKNPIEVRMEGSNSMKDLFEGIIYVRDAAKVKVVQSFHLRIRREPNPKRSYNAMGVFDYSRSGNVEVFTNTQEGIYKYGLYIMPDKVRFVNIIPAWTPEYGKGRDANPASDQFLQFRTQEIDALFFTEF